ncbi:MAG TPA: 1-acyl-sn-glycerol-3-phosphate acyltransferase [Acidimicrobiia bacterium]|nr:1-acyl-sn-glycerol-3-phosphate acyltransferase [Acidimicrobiia bacterium]
MARKPAQPPTLLTAPEGSRPVYLLDAASDYEAGMLTKWLAQEVGDGPTTIRITSSRRGRGGDPAALTEALTSPDDPYLIPLRVIWLAPLKRGRRAVSWWDALRPGDARDPRGLRARWVRAARPSRVRLIAALGEHASALAADYQTSGQVDPLSSYVTRRAWLTLDRAERRLVGNRYKIPRFVPEAILSRREFLQAVDGVAAETAMPQAVAREKAEQYLREIAATHSPFVIDLIANAIHKLYSQGYGDIKYSEDDVKMLAALGDGDPLVFLPAHRSNLDRLSLQFMLWENDFPPNHTAGGVNLNFFPVGPLVRRTGVFFIRRTFKDNPLYKVVLRSYLDYLIEKRFPLEWYMEGGRSRSGKMMPPRLGLLSYVVDSLHRGKAEDLQLIPVSIAYDQIQDVPDYAREAQGKDKEKESLGWMLKAVRSLRRRYGDIHIRFGQPVSARAMIGEALAEDETSIDLQKLAFEVMYRIGKVTPITPTALVSLALLEARGTARSAGQLAEETTRLTEFATARNLPTTEDADLRDATRVSAILDGLAEHDNVSSHEALGRRVFWLDEDQMIRISYYRNVIVHFFVNRALAEMAIGQVADGGDVGPGQVRDALLGFRDLLKFEFFFPEKEEFLAAIEGDIAIDVPGWDRVLVTTGAGEVQAKLGPPLAYWAVLPILDAYQVVGDELESMKAKYEERPFLKACLARARMYRIEQKLISGESASQVLFKSALSLAANRGLLDDTTGVTDRRRAFAAEVREARRLAARGL